MKRAAYQMPPTILLTSAKADRHSFSGGEQVRGRRKANPRRPMAKYRIGGETMIPRRGRPIRSFPDLVLALVVVAVLAAVLLLFAG
jgi:hypothetical protein